MHQLCGPIGGESSKSRQQKFAEHSTDISKRTFGMPKRVAANGTAKGHLTANGNGRKRSVEPRPHPAKLLNKRYWDDVRAGRVCPPSAVTEEKEQITDNNKGKYNTKNGANCGEKRKASMPLEIPSQNAKNNANVRNDSPILAQHRPSPAVAFSPPNPLLFQPQNIGNVQHGNSFLPQNRPLLRFGPFLPPPDILRPSGPVYVSSSPDAFFASQFSPPFECPSTASISNMNLAIPPLMMLQQQYNHHHQQFSSSAAESATAAALIEMLAKGTTPNGQQQQQQRNGIFSGQQQSAATTEAVKNGEPKMGVGCPSNLRGDSESDEQIDQLMDQIVQNNGENGTQQQAPIVLGRNARNSKVPDGECRLCFVPIPMPVPVPVPVSSDFILKHFGTMGQ